MWDDPGVQELVIQFTVWTLVDQERQAATTDFCRTFRTGISELKSPDSLRPPPHLTDENPEMK